MPITLILTAIDKNLSDIIEEIPYITTNLILWVNATQKSNQFSLVKICKTLPLNVSNIVYSLRKSLFLSLTKNNLAQPTIR